MGHRYGKLPSELMEELNPVELSFNWEVLARSKAK